MIIKKEKTIIETYYVCDLCGSYMETPKICVGCRKYICNDCRIYLEYDPFSDYLAQDYPDVLCKSCNEKLKSYKDEIIDLRDSTEDYIDKLHHKWLLECKSDT